MKYEEWLKEWLDLYVRPTVKKKTFHGYSESVRLYIVPRLGGYEMEELSATLLQKFTVELSETGNCRTKSGLSANTVGNIVTLVQKSLKQAVNVGVLEKQYSEHIVRPKAREKKVECFSLNEQKKIEKYILCSEKTKLIGIVLCLYTGVRIGELLALTWKDVSFKDGILSVTKACHDSFEAGRYIKVIDTPKTDCSVRNIPVPKQILVILKAAKKTSESQYIVANGEKEISVRSYQRTFEIILERLHIPHRGFHSLRHTFATRALECGMDVRTLSEILGHKNPTVTLSRYAHSMLEHKTAMMNKLGKLLQ